MISKPPALLVSWPQRLRADQKVKRACCESRAPCRHGSHPPVLRGGRIPFRGVLWFLTFIFAAEASVMMA